MRLGIGWAVLLRCHVPTICCICCDIFRDHHMRIWLIATSCRSAFQLLRTHLAAQHSATRVHSMWVPPFDVAAFLAAFQDPSSQCIPRLRVHAQWEPQRAVSDRGEEFVAHSETNQHHACGRNVPAFGTASFGSHSMPLRKQGILWPVIDLFGHDRVAPWRPFTDDVMIEKRNSTSKNCTVCCTLHVTVAAVLLNTFSYRHFGTTVVPALVI